MPTSEPDRRADTAGGYHFRDQLVLADYSAVVRIVATTGLFTPAEVDVAAELVDDRLTRGANSEYHFLLADDDDGRLAGYACYGHIACTQCSYDLYWIAVDPPRQGGGLGRKLLRRTEQAIAALGGRQVYAETSTREDYTPTRQFYERCGYRCESILRDFYAPGDHRATYSRRIGVVRLLS